MNPERYCIRNRFSIAALPTLAPLYGLKKPLRPLEGSSTVEMASPFNLAHCTQTRSANLPNP